MHAQTVDTRLFFSPPTKSLGTRLVSVILRTAKTNHWVVESSVM